jgi:hypothetical protein
MINVGLIDGLMLIVGRKVSARLDEVSVLGSVLHGFCLAPPEILSRDWLGSSLIMIVLIAIRKGPHAVSRRAHRGGGQFSFYRKGSGVAVDYGSGCFCVAGVLAD